MIGVLIKDMAVTCLNEVRPRRPEQSRRRRRPIPRSSGLNEVRPRRPEQSPDRTGGRKGNNHVSMKSGLEGRNNAARGDHDLADGLLVSMKSGLEGRNNTPADCSSCAACCASQ